VCYEIQIHPLNSGSGRVPPCGVIQSVFWFRDPFRILYVRAPRSYFRVACGTSPQLIRDPIRYSGFQGPIRSAFRRGGFEFRLHGPDLSLACGYLCLRSLDAVARALRVCGVSVSFRAGSVVVDAFGFPPGVSCLLCVLLFPCLTIQLSLGERTSTTFFDDFIRTHLKTLNEYTSLLRHWLQPRQSDV